MRVQVFRCFFPSTICVHICDELFTDSCLCSVVKSRLREGEMQKEMECNSFMGRGRGGDPWATVVS